MYHCFIVQEQGIELEEKVVGLIESLCGFKHVITTLDKGVYSLCHMLEM